MKKQEARRGGLAFARHAPWLLLLMVLASILLFRTWLAQAPPPQQRGAAAGPPGALPPPHKQPLILPTDYGGVHAFRIPGSFPPAPELNQTVSGMLHIYLKALRWRDGHVRLKGFAYFEFTRAPRTWKATRVVALTNMPQVFHHLRLGLRSPVHGWEREVAVETNFMVCEFVGSQKYDECVANLTTGVPPHTRPAYQLPDISVDLGPTAATDLQLFVYGWPRHVSLTALLQAALARREPAPPPSARNPGVLIAYPYLQRVDPDSVARLLGWSTAYHAALGFQGAVMYVLAKHAAALRAHPGVRALLASERLRLVLWDEFAWLEGWRDFDLRVQNSHQVLSFWGDNVRLLVADVDEFVVPGVQGGTLPQMLAKGGCLHQESECLYLQRRNVFVSDVEPAPVDEPALWNAPGHLPLRHYRFSASHAHVHPKALVDPSRVFPVQVHWSAVCVGKADVADGSSSDKLRGECSARRRCRRPRPSCTWIAHVGNMHLVRFNATGKRLPMLPEERRFFELDVR
ncbi:hypothetical protein C2E20_5971 [Micractinium conductrix]|uniref:Glycosyltransferase family 92 protein n=1 Tax=Micractinium conductrix TaxID=554055 RepID=A0A2P6V971_9CHLO|nr:hypothetical protein C2E20_5971 [Micractinium conductrix]|eukprot:PSC70647.1 hypothetical protein C2E20_5971 [Micractinium conductrix]